MWRLLERLQVAVRSALVGQMVAKGYASTLADAYEAVDRLSEPSSLRNLLRVLRGRFDA